MSSPGSLPVRFSVVIPTYNRERLIVRAIRCALEQTYPCDEVIVVDDGSDDGTAEAVAGCGPRVRFIRQDHGGPSRARNRGVREAAGDWIAFLDSDDLWHPGYLEHMAGAIRATDGAAALYFSDVEYDYGSTKELHWTTCGYDPGSPVAFIHPAVAIAMRGTHPMLLPFTVFRRDVYLRYGGLWEELWSAEDTHLFIRVGLHEAVCAVAGSGGIVTADESDPGNRLTIAYDTGTVRRWRAMVRMYEHLLATEPELPPDARRELRHRLAHSHWRVGRLSWQEGKGLDFIASLVRSVRTDPAVVPAVLRDAWRRKTGRA